MSTLVQLGALNLATTAAANAIGTWLDGDGDPTQRVSPEALEAAIVSGRPVVLEAMAEVSAGKLAGARMTFGALAVEFGRTQTGPDGRDLGHPYMWVLQKLAKTHPDHAAVVNRHQAWYREQMDGARVALFGGKG